LYGGPAAAVRQRHLNQIHLYIHTYIQGNLFADDVQVESAVMLCVNLYSSGVIAALNEFNLAQPGTSVCFKARVKGCIYI